MAGKKKEEAAIAEPKPKKMTKAKEKALSIQLTDFIFEAYNVTFLPKHFYMKLQSIYKGELNNMSEPIPVDDLLYMWKSKMDYLNKTYEYNKEHGKDMVGIQRISYDLAILLNKYDSYKRWKEKQNAIHEQQKKTVEEHKQSKAIQKIQPKSQHQEDDNIDDIIDEI